MLVSTSKMLVVESRRNRSLSPARPPSRRGWPSLSSLSSCPGLYQRTTAHLERRPCSRPSVHPTVRVADQPFGVLLTCLDATASPPAAVSVPSWVRSRPARPDQVSCPLPPPPIDGPCHIVTSADGNPPECHRVPRRGVSAEYPTHLW